MGFTLVPRILLIHNYQWTDLFVLILRMEVTRLQATNHSLIKAVSMSHCQVKDKSASRLQKHEITS